MRREVALYIGAILLVGAVFLFSFFQPELTGFAVFQQQDQSGFDEGVYENVFYDSNLSAIVLSANQTSGDYTSKIFDAGNNSVWNNLTWVGQGSLDFQIRACSSSGCSNSTFSSVDLTNINLTSQYFQYKVSFTEDPNLTIFLESVSIDYSVLISAPAFSTTIHSPLNQTYETISIALDVTSVGTADTWWYNLNSGNDTTFTPNTTITGVEGANTLTVYANESGGNITSQSASFTITFPVCDSSHLSLCVDEASCTAIGKYWYDSSCNAGEESQEETTETETEVTLPEVTSPQAPASIPKLSFDDTQPLTLIPEESGVISLVSRNTGTKALSSCTLTLSGDSSEWVSYPQDSFNLNVGADMTSSLTVSIPVGVEVGSYSVEVSVGCFEITKSTSLTINVIQKTFEFELDEVRKIRDNEVRATYTLTDLLNEDQVIELRFALFDNESLQVSEISESVNLTANSIEEFSSVLEVNESVEGNLTIQIDINSQTYSSSVNEAIVLGSPPLLGFAIFDQIGGTGGLIVLVISVLAIVVIILISRKLRKARKITTK